VRLSSASSSPASPEVSGGDVSLRPAVREQVHGIVLAGAHGWTESPLERVVCRPLVPIVGRPLLFRILDWIRSGGVETASICANTDTLLLRRSLGDGSELGIGLDYFEDVMPRGPAGCARDVAGQGDSETFVVIEGSILPKIDLEDLLDTHAASGAALTIVVTQAPLGEEGLKRVYRPAGVYVFSKRAMDHIPRTGYQDIKETLIPRLHVSGERVETYAVPPLAVSRVSGIGSYLAVSERMVQEAIRDDALGPRYAAHGEARVHSSARIDPSARLIGPVVVSEGCTIEGAALIVGPCTIGEGCRIGAGSTVSRSVLWSQCTVGAGSVVDQCILTHRAGTLPGVRIRHSVVASMPRPKGSLLDRVLGMARPAVPGSGLEPVSGALSPGDRRVLEHTALSELRAEALAASRPAGGRRSREGVTASEVQG
jgi:NDP-sugar pyrophosphorylase family protein